MSTTKLFIVTNIIHSIFYHGNATTLRKITFSITAHNTQNLSLRLNDSQHTHTQHKHESSLRSVSHVLLSSCVVMQSVSMLNVVALRYRGNAVRKH
jgi:hypothetical protein